MAKYAILFIFVFGANAANKNIGNWQEFATTGESLPPFIVEAAKLAGVKPANIVVISDVKRYMPGYLAQAGYDPKFTDEVVRKLQGLEGFVFDQRLPIFLNINSTYRGLEKCWNKAGQHAQACMVVMASHLYHEFQHATKRADEVAALTAQIVFLRLYQQEDSTGIIGQAIMVRQKQIREERALLVKH